MGHASSPCRTPAPRTLVTDQTGGSGHQRVARPSETQITERAGSRSAAMSDAERSISSGSQSTGSYATSTSRSRHTGVTRSACYAVGGRDTGGGAGGPRWMGYREVSSVEFVLRRVTCAVVAVLVVGFVGVGSALADDPPPPLLTGEGGTSNAFTPGLIPASNLDIQIQSVCDVAGESTVEWTGTGTATGPVRGHFHSVGPVKIGPQTSLGGVGQPAAPSGPLFSMNFDFTIDSPTGLVEGSIGTPYGNGGTCTSTGFPDATSPTIVTWERVVDALATFVPYDVTVTTASGTTHIYGQLNYARLTDYASDHRGYLGSYCEPQLAGTTVTCSGQSFGMFISSSWYAPGDVTVALSSPSTQHAERYSTFTATVKDIYGSLIDGIPVVAQIEGANGPSTLYCGRTGGNNPGQCDFYYQGHQAGDDLITVCPDANTDGQPDAELRAVQRPKRGFHRFPRLFFKTTAAVLIRQLVGSRSRTCSRTTPSVTAPRSRRRTSSTLASPASRPASRSEPMAQSTWHPARPPGSTTSRTTSTTGGLLLRVTAAHDHPVKP